MSNLERVHVIFKTHLDIGFTHSAANVARQYREEFIPKALDLAERMADDPGADRFVWTVGSWLIQHYLELADEADRKRMERAIERGFIAWHALPFTTHTELMDPRLFTDGLSLSRRLDERYGKTTIAAKMTDVPGHTIAMVPLLQEAGVRYLHIGVNPASKLPAVPKLFRWRTSDGAEIIVNYAGTYGEVLEADGLKDALVFAHTGDNCGPPAEAEIRAQFAELRQRFPGAEVMASTLDAFAARLEAVRDRLPVVTEEIGDTWIHGAATDPRKLAEYRELLRLRRRWLADGGIGQDDADYRAMSEALMLVAEHTWGLDVKKWLPDFRHYAKADFRDARARDDVDPTDIPAKYGYIGAFALDEFDKQSSALFNKESSRRSYSMLESSWAEQRGYVTRAAQALRPELRQEAERALANLTPRKSHLSGAVPRLARTSCRGGRFEVAFSERGAIIDLIDGNGKNWTSERYPLGEFVYETFGTEDYARYFRTYMENLPVTHPWADADFGKPGFEQVRPLPAHRLYSPVLDALEFQELAASDRYVMRLRLPAEAAERYGAPRELELAYDFPHRESALDVTLQWFGKEANRLPEACWLSCGLAVDNPNLWMMNKLGRAVSPLQVVKDGNRNLHAVDAGVFYEGADGKAAIENLDAALVAPGERRMLRFDNTFASLEQGWHFNLHNNIWGTNFPMWYGEDAKFRFRVKLESHPKS